jgi:hypothetical protein
VLLSISLSEICGNTTGDSAAEERRLDGDGCERVTGLIGAIHADRLEIMTDPKGSKGAPSADGAGVQAKNTILVAMEDLIEADRKELERELEEEMAQRHQKKLACFQQTHNGVVKNADMATTLGVEVNTSLSPEDLVHMVDVSVARKYGTDRTQFTHVVAEDMKCV